MIKLKDAKFNKEYAFKKIAKLKNKLEKGEFDNMREINKNTIYKHFKGQEYIVLGVSTPTSRPSGGNGLICKHTERDLGLSVFNRGGEFTHWKNTCNKQLVVYMALYGSYELYVRPYEMFMSEVDIDKHPNSKQTYRFEEVFNVPPGYAKLTSLTFLDTSCGIITARYGQKSED